MRIAIGLCVFALLLGSTQAGETGWRTDGTGKYPGAEPPVTFSPEEKVVWSAPMPSWSNASPVVLEDRIFVCAEPDLLIAVDKKTGTILWQKASPVVDAAGADVETARTLAKTHPHNGFTSATPVTDGKHVYAVFGSGVVSAFDMDGNQLWSRFVERPVHKWGHSASPMLAGGKLLVHIVTLRALDLADGKEVWKQPVETWTDPRKKQWGSPLATRIGDVDVLITTSGRMIRVADGEVLHSDLASINFSAPIVEDGIAYFFASKVGRAVRLPATVDEKPEVLWTTETVKERFYGSPLLHDGLIYAISRKGHFSAFDAVDGKEVYRTELLLAKTQKEKNAAYSSPTLAGNLIYLAGMDGAVLVVKPGRTYEEVARNTVETSLRSCLVFEGKRMYLRAPEHLYCFGE